MRARVCWWPGSAGCWRGAACGWRRSRRRTCPTTPWSLSTAVRSGGRRPCRRGPAAWSRVSGSIRCCSSLEATERSQLVVRGGPWTQWARATTSEHRQSLRAVVADELATLRAEFDVVICEGAGSPAEINLRATDLANMGLATAARCRCSWWGISIAGECSPICSAPWRCCLPKTRQLDLGIRRSTNSAVMWLCCGPESIS